MSPIFSKNKFFKYFQIIFFSLLLILGWAFGWVGRLFNFSSQKVSRGWNIQSAKAQTSVCWTTSASALYTSTPFLACWNGRAYQLENDILYGKPTSHFLKFKEGLNYYQNFQITPDFYKFINIPKAENGVLKFQIQEIEPEESFFNYLKLFRVVHAKNAEIITDSDFKNFSVFGEKVLKKAVLPEAGVKFPKFLESGECVDLVFKNLKPSDKLYLITKAGYRDWVLGEAENYRQKSVLSKILKSKTLAKIAAGAALFFALTFWKKSLASLSLAPFMLTDSGGDPGEGGSTGTGNDPGGIRGGKCLTLFYKNNPRDWQYFSTIFPRAWQANLELTQIPREAVHEGSLELKIRATKRHELEWIGLLKNPKEKNFKIEPLALKSARHSRFGEEVSGILQKRNDGFIRTVPGDTIDLEFTAPAAKLGRNQKESYLIQAGGFYTPLTKEGKKLAGNWQEKISQEAKERLANLKSLSDYSPRA